MEIWVDGDACPREAKDLVFKTANRLQIITRLVTNTAFRYPDSPWIELHVVPSGLDLADDYIVEHLTPGDLVITADIPLAARSVDAGALALDPRGKVFNPNNVKDRLATRNLLADLRQEGLMGGGPPPYKPKDRSEFASALDRLVRKMMKGPYQDPDWSD